MGHDRFQKPAGEALRRHQAALAEIHLRDLLTNTDRPASMTLAAGPLTVDFSRMLGDATTLQLLAELADELNVPQQVAAMTSGSLVNTTEGRAALHTALRASADPPIILDGQDVLPDVAETAARVSDFVEGVTSGIHRGATGHPITDVVVIGIGGSDLGPRMVTAATRQHHIGQVRVHFVANVDPAELDAILPRLAPASTLVVVVSKTFTTVETLANATAAREWLVADIGEVGLTLHLAAVTTADDSAATFGVPADAVFGFHDWVGGRFSLSSAVGIGIEFAIGREGMRSLRAGMRAVDDTLLTEPAGQNAALLLGMLDVWYTQYFRTTSKAVVPYAQDLALLPSHLQQLQMESNGKSVTTHGDDVSWLTSPVVWGAPGTNGQHAFFQLLHQGTSLIPVDFIGVHSIVGAHRA
ncbi:MAG: glucose-6-phosphate isomerase, partial [Actinomycetia bacterium]|nr:glucose-6-phosphate isomerase [Actinomycetes bacterium]